MNQEAGNSARVEVLPAGTGIFARVEELVQAHRRDDPFGLITVVVPSNYSSFYLRRRLAPGGYFNVELTRLDDLAEKIGGSQVDRPPLTRLQAAALVYSAAMSAPPGSRIGPIRSHPSLHTALRSTFRQLEALDQDPVPLLLQESELVREAGGVYETYRQSRAGWREQVDVARAAASALEKGDYPVAWFGKLIVLRVEAPPPQFVPLDRALVRVPGASILVALTGDDEADRLVGANVPVSIFAGSSPASGQGESRVNLISSPDRASEVRHVVRKVVRLARERGIPFYRMAVLFDDYSYGDRVEEALKFAGVPVSGPDPVPDSASPEGRFITGLLDLFLAHQKGGWTRQDFAKWVTSAPVAYPDTDQEVPAARWDAISRSASVTPGLKWLQGAVDKVCAPAEGIRRKHHRFRRSTRDSRGVVPVAGRRMQRTCSSSRRVSRLSAPSARSCDLPTHCTLVTRSLGHVSLAFGDAGPRRRTGREALRRAGRAEVPGRRDHGPATFFDAGPR